MAAFHGTAALSCLGSVLISAWMPPVGVGVDEAVEGEVALVFEEKEALEGRVDGERDGGGGGGPCGCGGTWREPDCCAAASVD